MGDALEAHDQALRYGGRDGIADLGMVDSAISRPYTGYHRRIERKAAALLESMAQNHGFIDGNKRTAVMLVDLLIAGSGYHLNLNPGEEIDDLVLEVVNRQRNYDDLVDWFKARIRAA